MVNYKYNELTYLYEQYKAVLIPVIRVQYIHCDHT
jgi:hypothetical protein